MTSLITYVSFCIASCLCTTDINLLPPYRSIPEQTQTISIYDRSTASLKLDVPQTKQNTDGIKWNGGTVLTSQANTQSQPFVGRSETCIASTRCGNLIFIGFNNAQGFCYNNDETNPSCPGVPSGFENGGTHYTVSRDGGKTWAYLYGLPSLGTELYTSSDPWMSMGGKSADGTEELLYFASVGRNSSAGFANVGIIVHVARIIYKNNNPMRKAIDFEWIRVNVIPTTNPTLFLDKEAIAADPFNPNKAYLSVTEILRVSPFGNDIQVFSTQDAGESWQGPVVVYDSDFNNEDPLLQATFTMPVVGANGNVYVVWMERAYGMDFIRTLKYRFKKSLDNGQTFVPDESIVINPNFTFFNNIAQIPVAHNRFVIPPQPTMDIFTTVYDKRHNYLNRIIIAYEYALSDEFNSAIDGFIDDNDTLLNSNTFGVSYSDDEGDTWHFIDPFKQPIPDRFVKRKYPTVSVSTNGKSVNIAYIQVTETKLENEPICEVNVDNFGSQRSSLYHSIADHYYIHSDDGGDTWSDPIKLNDFSVDWCISVSANRPNFGDYMLSISDSRGGVQVAGQTNGFTLVNGFEPKTAPDVIYFYSKRERCYQTKDCLVKREHKGKKKRNLLISNDDITCSCYVKWNIHPFKKYDTFCCVKNMGMCQNDNDCCGGKTKCINYKCVNSKQWRSEGKYSAFTNVEYEDDNEIWTGKNLNVEIKLSWISTVIAICCIGVCCGLSWFIWMKMFKE